MHDFIKTNINIINLRSSHTFVSLNLFSSAIKFFKTKHANKFIRF